MTYEETIKLFYFLDLWDWCKELKLNFDEIYYLEEEVYEGNGEYDQYYQDF